MSPLAVQLPTTNCPDHHGATGSTDPCNWRRLGAHVVSRRVQLGYRTRPPFSAASGISLRILGDIETGRRGNFDRATLAAIEHTLRWATGSVAAILAGGEPADAAPAGQQTAEPDEALMRVMRSDLPDGRKRQLVQMLIEERKAADRLRVRHAEELIRFAGGQ